ncbi:hypothetical protein [Dyadobacter sp. 32]|uniref:hypothetical protein n=1 Tax=Dyadobacter sp. 32 TaxID=538966 RepID=UPI0011F0676E
MIEFLTNLYPTVRLDQELSDELNHKTTRLDVFQRHRFLQPGQLQESIYFIKDGVIRSYYFKRETEFTNWFFSVGDMMIPSTDFFLPKTESTVYLEAATKISKVLELKKKTSLISMRNIQFLECL